MKKLVLLFFSFSLVACTSNSIYKKPADLIPRDTMALLIKDLYLASAAKVFKNKNLVKKGNYMALVYEQYGIDSLRFKRSNFYYTTVIDEYESLLKEIEATFKKQKKELKKAKLEKDKPEFEDELPTDRPGFNDELRDIPKAKDGKPELIKE